MSFFNKIIILVFTEILLLTENHAQNYFKIIKNAYYWNNSTFLMSIQRATNPATCLIQFSKTTLPYIITVEKPDQNTKFFSCSVYHLDPNFQSITTYSQNSTLYLLNYLCKYF